MKKALPVIVLGAGVLVVAGLLIGSRLLSQDKGEVVTQDEERRGVEVSQEEEVETESFSGKIKDALSLGKSMECTWRKDNNNFGTAYIKNEKVYTDVTAEGQEMHSIVADNCTYWWEEGQTQGYKICVEPTEEEKEVEPASEAFSWETPNISYNCKPALISDSKFNPPSSIQFTDLLESMQDLNLPIEY